MLSKILVFITLMIIFFSALSLIKKYTPMLKDLIKSFQSSSSNEEKVHYNDKDLPFNYQKVMCVFNADEWYFWSILEHAATEFPIKILAKISLDKLLKIDKKNLNKQQNSQLRLIHEHDVDFLIIDAKTSKPILIIQFKDKAAAHEEILLQEIVQQLDIAIAYVKPKSQYNKNEINLLIREAIQF
jgi:hypothetical protein